MEAMFGAVEASEPRLPPARDGLEPADVVVGVGDEVDVDHPGLRGMARLVPAFLG